MKMLRINFRSRTKSIGWNNVYIPTKGLSEFSYVYCKPSLNDSVCKRIPLMFSDGNDGSIRHTFTFPIWIHIFIVCKYEQSPLTTSAMSIELEIGKFSTLLSAIKYQMKQQYLSYSSILFKINKSNKHLNTLPKSYIYWLLQNFVLLHSLECEGLNVINNSVAQLKHRCIYVVCEE